MLAILRQRDVALLWSAGLISTLGDWVLGIALPFYIYQRTGSVLATSTMFVVGTLPGLLFGSAAGTLVDRWDRKRVLVIGNLLQTVLVLGLLFVRSGAWLWLAYVVAFSLAVVVQFSGPAESALLPRLVGEARLIPMNALKALSDNLARLVGPPLGGALVGGFGIGSVILLDSLSFLCAAVLIVPIGVAAASLPHEGQRGEHDARAIVPASRGTVRREWLEGLGLIGRSRVVTLLLTISALVALANGVRSPLMIPFVGTVLGGGALGFGLIASVQGIGGLLGGVLVGRWGARLGPARLLVLGQGGIALLILALISVRSLALALVLVGLVGLPGIAQGTGHQTLLQGSVADRYRGRVFGTLGTVTSVLALIGFVTVGLLGDVVGTVPLLYVTGGLDVVAGLVAVPLLGRVIEQEAALSRGQETCSSS